MKLSLVRVSGERGVDGVELERLRGQGWRARRCRETCRSRRADPVAWVVLRAGELQRRDFWLDEAVVRADPGVVPFEALQHLGPAAADVVWTVRPQAAQSGRVRVELRSVARRVAEQACERTEVSGATVERVVDPADLIEAAWWHGGRALDEASSLVLSIGESESLLLWLAPGMRRVRSLTLGARITREEVERRSGPTASESSGSPVAGREIEATARLEADVVATLAARAHLEVSRWLALAASEPEGWPTRPARLWVHGGEEALAPGFRAALGARLGLPVNAWTAIPPSLFTWEPEFALRERASWEREIEGVLCLREDRPGDAPMEASFLPPERRRRLTRRFAHVTALGAVALVTVAALPPAWHYHRLAAETADRVRALSAEVERLRRLDAENRAALQRVTAERERVEALQALAEARLQWPRLLGGLEACLEEVEDAWLDGLQAAGDLASRREGGLRIRVTGGLLAAEPGERSASVGELEAEPRVQALLARMSRLPSVARIERERFSRDEPGLLRFDLELALVREALR